MQSPEYVKVLPRYAGCGRPGVALHKGASVLAKVCASFVGTHDVTARSGIAAQRY